MKTEEEALWREVERLRAEVKRLLRIECITGYALYRIGGGEVPEGTVLDGDNAIAMHAVARKAFLECWPTEEGKS